MTQDKGAAGRCFMGCHHIVTALVLMPFIINMLTV